MIEPRDTEAIRSAAQLLRATLPNLTRIAIEIEATSDPGKVRHRVELDFSDDADDAITVQR